MKILGIETSCDETAAAVVEDNTILSSITATSAGIHARTGGVIPEDAARKQILAILPVIELALKDAHVSLNDIDVIAVTAGPGLIGSLLVGVETAKTLSILTQKPIVPVNHLVGHIYANWLTNDTLPKFPVLALVVSGGHTDLVLMQNHEKIELIGSTRDDAAGEAFDKTARLLGFPYPGGPTLSKAADEFIKNNPKESLSMFPRPMKNDPNIEWSFSGLKTSVLNKIKTDYVKNQNLTLADYEQISSYEEVKKDMPFLAAQVQEAIVDSLVEKTVLAAKKLKPKSLVLAGGVSANSRLREKFITKISDEKLWDDLHVPPLSLCTDNAAYIAACALYHYRPTSWDKITAKPNLTIVDFV